MANKLQKVSEKNESIVLDFAQVFVKRHHGALLAPLKASMTLYERKGQIYRMRDKYLLTSDGYIALNKVASISIATPQNVVVDGKEYPNPFIERNPRTKIIESVNIRKIGIGFSPVGNITMIDKTLSYHLYSYLLQSFQAKMKRQSYDEKSSKKSEKSAPCAFVGTQDEKFELAGKWVWFENVAPLGIWVNYEDQLILDCLEEHVQRQRFAERIASKIIERNIFKSHPAIGVSLVEAEKDEGNLAKASVTVYGWRHELIPSEINALVERAENGDEDIERKAEKIDAIAEEEEKSAIEETEEEEERRLFKESK